MNVIRLSDRGILGSFKGIRTWTGPGRPEAMEWMIGRGNFFGNSRFTGPDLREMSGGARKRREIFIFFTFSFDEK